MRLIHTADWHLGASLESVLPADLAAVRRAELLDTFSRMLDYAEENDVAAVLIAGDLFDSDRVRASAADRLCRLIAAHPRITFYYLRGNHDENARIVFPENVRTFSHEFTSYPLGEGVTLYGCEAPDRHAYETFSPDENERNIVLLHGAVTESGYGEDIVNLRALRNRGIDCLALGHYHTNKKEALDRRGFYLYAGTPEGRGFDEPGEKGFYLLDIDKAGVAATFVPFAARTVHIVAPDLAGAADFDAAVRALDRALSDCRPCDIVRVELTGGGPLSPAVTDRLLKDRFFYAESRYTHGSARDTAEDYMDDISLRGEFVRLVRDEDLTDEEKEAVLQYGLAALRGEEAER